MFLYKTLPAAVFAATCGDIMSTGTLYLIATPIGNLEDITLRALRILQEVDLIAAEDTRKTGMLLKQYTIKKPLTSYHDHNERSKALSLTTELQSGRSVALVTSAGTPTVSDPGYRIVRSAVDSGIPVVSVPGACAAVAALSVSGLPVHRFLFAGFLPPRTGKRKAALTAITDLDATLIFYESPHRICATLQDMLETLGDRPAVLCREMTKLHEEHIRGTLSEIQEDIQKNKIRGEITLLVAGKGVVSKKAEN